MKPKVVLSAAGAALAGVAIRDLTQNKHSLQRNFPVVAHARYALEKIGPELRQYIVTSNDEERPFSRDQRSWIYASAKLQNNYTGFGTDNDIESGEYVIFKQHTFSDVVPPSAVHAGEHVWLPSPKILGGPRGRRDAFRPDSVVNISAMSFGSLSGNAVEALNAGAKLANCMHNTGEGGLSPHHRQGGDLMLQIGTAYFGCRDDEGRFDLDKLMKVVESAPVRAIEIKLSQGAKPGLGGMLPAAKITPEIAEIRGIPLGKDCASPSRHAEFSDVDSMLDFVEKIAQATGKPVGIKSAVGDLTFWKSLVDEMQSGSRGVDFVTIDGGEGGRVLPRSSSAMRSRCPSGSASPAYTRPSPPQVSRTRSPSSGPASWGCPTMRWSPSPSARTWSMSPARPCWRWAASRRRNVTPTTAQRGSPPKTSGCSAALTRP